MTEPVLWNGFALSLPAGWEAVEREASIVVVPVDELAALAADLSPMNDVAIVRQELRGLGVDEHVSLLMARRLGRGEADTREVLLFGRTVIEHEWTDGVALTSSRFFARSDALFEVWWSRPGLRFHGQVDHDEAGRRLFEEGIRLAGPIAAAGD